LIQILNRVNDGDECANQRYLYVAVESADEAVPKVVLKICAESLHMWEQKAQSCIGNDENWLNNKGHDELSAHV